MSNIGDDCYFYYYSTCTKGKDCPFRHCQLALGTETVCTLWREGLCARANCKFRHMESRINRAHIPCYWENQPGGCRKPHCVFFHKKLRNVVPSSEKSQSLILPVASKASSPHTQLSPAPDVLPDSTKSFSPSNEQTAENQPLNSPSVPVEPLVVSLNDGEESDAESTTSTPAKNISSRISPFERRLPKMSGFDEDQDFGIKTLEQLKMEKIHRESEHFYKPNIVLRTIIDNVSQVNNLSGDCKNLLGSVCDDPLLEIHEMDQQMNVSRTLDKKSRYAVLVENTRFGSYQRNLEKTLENLSCKRKLNDTTSNVVTCDNSSDDLLASSDLRDVIIKKKRVEHTRSSLSPDPKKRVISLKKTADVLNNDASSITITLGEEKPIKDQKTKERPPKPSQKVEKPTKGNMDFRIKTLDEIRQEKNKKKPSLKMDEDIEKSRTREEIVEEAEPVSTLRSTVQAVKPKLKRPAREIYQVKNRESLSPKKDYSLQGLVAKTLKLSPSPKKPLSLIQKVIAPNAQPSLIEKPKKEWHEVLDHRTLKLKKKIIAFENGHQGSNETGDFKVKSSENKNSSLKSIQSFIRHRIIPNLHAEYSNEILSVAGEDVQQNSHTFSETNTEDAPSDVAIDCSKVISHEQSQENGIDSTNVSVESPSNRVHPGNTKFQKTSREFSSSSSNQTAPKTSSTTDDFDKLLLGEECGLSLDDLGDATEKADDIIFLEIDELLQS